MVFVPGSLLTLSAGFVFGLAKGTVVASLGSTAGAAAALSWPGAWPTTGSPDVWCAGRS
ncbi:MAG: hypothetical protein ACREUZ_19335 [Burkholderiales bacterium]